MPVPAAGNEPRSIGELTVSMADLSSQRSGAPRLYQRAGVRITTSIYLMRSDLSQAVERT